MSDVERLEERLKAVERTVIDGEYDLGELSGLESVTEDIERIESRLDSLEDRIASLEATTQSIDGYVSNVESVNESVEQQANAAAAAVDRLERRVDEFGQGNQGEFSAPKERPPENSSPHDRQEDQGNGDTDDVFDRVPTSSGSVQRPDIDEDDTDPLWEGNEGEDQPHPEESTEEKPADDATPSVETPESEPLVEEESDPEPVVEEESDPEPVVEEGPDPEPVVEEEPESETSTSSGNGEPSLYQQVGIDDTTASPDINLEPGDPPGSDDATAEHEVGQQRDGARSTDVGGGPTRDHDAFSSDIAGKTYRQPVDELFDTEQGDDSDRSIL